jgi:hypothetical protein
VGSLVTAALARVQGFLLAPAGAAPAADVLGARPPTVARPLRVAVIGLTRQSGATTVARGLARALAVPGVRASHLVSLDGDVSDARPAKPATVTRWQVPPALRDPAEVAEYGETIARLAGGTAALVWDFSAADSEVAAAALEASDRAVAVASGTAEPALASLVGSMLAERVGDVLLVANRVLEPDGWAGRCLTTLPESRFGAFAIAHGRMPAGELGARLHLLAAAVEEDL